MDIPGYKIDHILGQGGMATVYLALQVSLNREIAFKVMSPEFASEKNFTQRFIKEGRIVAQLSHPHIVTIYDIGNHGSYNYMAMEYANAGTFKERIKKGLPIEQGIQVIKEIGEALGAAHESGIIHRDIKPANILFRSNGTSVLTDFGIAKGGISNMERTATGVAMGTPHYMSPEQAKGEGVSPQSDFYSLGVVLYEVLTGGQKPFQGPDHFAIAIKHIQDPIPTLPLHLAPYQPLLNRLLAKHAAERFQNAKELSCAIDGLLQSSLMDITAITSKDINTANSDSVVTDEPQKETTETTNPVVPKVEPYELQEEVTEITDVDLNIERAQQAEAKKTGALPPTKRKTKPRKGFRWLLVSGILGLLAGVGVGAYALFWDRGPVEYLPFPAVPAYTLSKEQSESILRQTDLVKELLELSQDQKYDGLGRYAFLIGGGVETAYQGILDLDPNNDFAQKGMIETADAYRDMAIELLALGERENSLEKIEQGLASLKEFPNLLPKLQALQKEVSTPDPLSNTVTLF